MLPPIQAVPKVIEPKDKAVTVGVGVRVGVRVGVEVLVAILVGVGAGNGVDITTEPT